MSRNRVTISVAASLDVAAILEHIATTDGLEAALVVDELIDGAIRSLDQLADRGRVVPELARRGITAYRELIASPYRVIYRVVRAEVWVLAVIDGRRDAEELLYARARRGEL